MADITYCGKIFCKHKECERHVENIPEYEDDYRISFADFAECEYFESEE